MLPRSIPRLYDNISDPPPYSNSGGYYYAQTLKYFMNYQNAQTPYSISPLAQLAFMKYTSPYCPYTELSVTRWKPVSQYAFEPSAVYQTVRRGIQGVFLNTSSWGGGETTQARYCYRTTGRQIDVINNTETELMPVSQPSGNIIVGFNKSHYVLVARVRALSSDGQNTWNGTLKDYRSVMTTYPYIIRLTYFPYYKSNLNSTSKNLIDMAICCTGTHNMLGYSGQSSGTGDLNFQNMIYYDTAYSCHGNSTDGFVVFSSPSIFGYWKNIVSQGNIKIYAPHYDSANTGFVTTHSIEICDYVEFTPNNVNNVGAQYYITIDTATKIFNSLGFIWAESDADVKDYHGKGTTSNNIHMPTVNNDGSTTDISVSGSDIYEQWDDDALSDPMGNVIDLDAPVDMSSDIKDIDDETSELLPTTPVLNGLGVFANYYTLPASNVLALSDFLWNADETVIDDLVNSLKLFGQNPINAVMSLRLYPFNIYDLLPTHEVSRIVLGRVDTGVNAIKIPNNASTVIDLGSMYIKPKYNDFRDYSPFTSYNLYIPFIGTVVLNPNDYLGRVLSIKMVVDITTGKATAILYAEGIPMQYLDGMIGIDIPITSSNMSEMVSSVINAVGYTAAAIGQIATGNYVGAAVDVAAGIGDVLFNDVSISKQGNVSPAASLSMPINAYMIVSRPNCVIPENYGHTHGYVCDKTAIVSTLSGYTVCHNVDTSGIPATERERNEIKTLMEGGIYL